MFERLYANWVYGGAIAGLMMLALLPLTASNWTTQQVLVYLCLPIYMLHQYEEHDGDRFRHAINERLGTGRRGLSLRAVFVMNIIGVWALLTAVQWAVHRIGIGWGVIAAYFLLINAVVHIGAAITARAGNPGLVTAALLFLPLGALTLSALWPSVSVENHVIGLTIVLGIHGSIIAHATRSNRA